jgi:hypothetical protein
MGYYSEVCLTLTKEANEALLAHLNTSAEYDEALALIEDPDYVYNNDESILYHWEEVKWYDDDSGYGSYYIHEFLNRLSSNEYHFLRVGEDAKDIEIRGRHNPFSVSAVVRVESDLF